MEYLISLRNVSSAFGRKWFITAHFLHNPVSERRYRREQLSKAAGLRCSDAICLSHFILLLIRPTSYCITTVYSKLPMITWICLAAPHINTAHVSTAWRWSFTTTSTVAEDAWNVCKILLSGKKSGGGSNTVSHHQPLTHHDETQII